MPAAAWAHPLDPLTADEIRTAAAIAKSDARLAKAAFASVVLQEPSKADVIASISGRFTVARQARIVAMVDRSVFEAVVDLDTRQVASIVERRGVEPSVEATVHYTNPGAWTFTNGAHLAMVEIDVETGRVRLVKYVAVDDCGRIVNPALVDGQVRGGVAQGVGGALMEHCAFDDAGQLLSATLMDYALPSADDLPAIEVHHLETPAPGLAGGFKGAGEDDRWMRTAALAVAAREPAKSLAALLATPDDAFVKSAQGRAAIASLARAVGTANKADQVTATLKA
jgi:CO/xanthine dehydrogenase Mo-binding subunit